jgi:hypothetical protein
MSLRNMIPSPVNAAPGAWLPPSVSGILQPHSDEAKPVKNNKTRKYFTDSVYHRGWHPSPVQRSSGKGPKHASVAAMRYILAFFVFSASAYAHNAFESCNQGLRARDKVLASFNFEPNLRSKELKSYDKDPTARIYQINAIHPRYGIELSLIEFTVYDNGTKILIDKMEVLNENNYDRGLSTWLFQKMLEQNPLTRKIQSRLGFTDNLRQVREQIEQNPNCLETFAQTATYKLAQRYGFTKATIVTCNPNLSDYEFTLELEPAH